MRIFDNRGIALHIALLAFMPVAYGANPIPFLQPNDPFLERQNYLKELMVPAAWKFSQGEGVVVAVMDSGFSENATDLSGAFLSDEFVLEGVTPDPLCPGHGSLVSSMLAARMDDGVGIAGIAPKARILKIKLGCPKWLALRSPTLEDQVKLHREYIQNLLLQGADAIRWAVRKGAQVINMSFTVSYFVNGKYELDGLEAELVVFHAAIAEARAAGVVTVAAAGNWSGGWDNAKGEWFSVSDQGKVALPAAFPEVISAGCVCADQQCGRVSSIPAIPGMPETQFKLMKQGHHYGDRLDFVVPCDGMPASQNQDGSYDFYALGGTSHAAPEVSGVVALMLSVNPALRPDEVKEILARTSTDLMTPRFDVYTGFGKLNAYRAVQEAIAAPTPSNARASSRPAF
ncbi:MAG: S8 family serine peptidase [Oligoflexia bacterium]|nr:S8 family serine peptidase [Oligoflexia bacterium]